MKHRTVWLLVALLVFGIGFSGCSKSEEAASQKATVEEVTDEAAKTIKEKMDAPIDKARAAHNLGDERTEAIDQAIKAKE